MKPLKTQLAEKNLSGAYLLYGEEDYLKDHYCRTIVGQLVDPAFADFNLLTCGQKADLSAIGAFLDAFPMMADKKVLVMRSTGLFHKPSAEEKEFWSSALQTLPASAVVVFVESEADKRGVLYKAMNASHTVEEYKKQQKSDLINWAGRHLREYGKTMDKADIELVIDNVDSSMYALKNELDKLCSYCGDGTKITREMVECISCRNAENRIFQMIDHISAGRGAEAIGELHDLKTLKQDPVALITLVARQYTILRKIKVMGSAPAGAMAKACGVPEFALRRYLPMARALSADALTDAISLCQQADYQVKSGMREAWLAVDMLVGQLLGFSGSR